MRESRILSVFQGLCLAVVLMIIFAFVWNWLGDIASIPAKERFFPIVFFGAVLITSFSILFFYQKEFYVFRNELRRLHVTHEISKKDLLHLYPYNLVFAIHKLNSFGRVSEEEFLYRIYVPGVMDVVESKLTMQERDIIRLKYRYALSDSKISEMRSISKSEIQSILKSSYYKIRNASERYISASYREKELMKSKLEDSERKLRVLISEKGTKNLRIYTSNYPVSMLKLSDYVKDRLLKAGIQYIEDLGDMSVDEFVNRTHLDSNGVVELAYQLERVGIKFNNSRTMNEDSTVRDSSNIVSL